MLERSTALSPEEAHEELRKILLREKCKIIKEEYPKRIVVEQGSWPEYSPRTCQKVISFHFIPHNSGTRIVSDTSWKSLRAALSILGLTSLAIVAGFLW